MKELSGSEAVYGVLAWLSCREKPVTLGATHNGAEAAELADKFCKTNNLLPPGHDFHLRLIHPEE